MLYEFEGKRPSIDPSAFISDSAVIIGDVTIGARATDIHRRRDRN